MKSVRGLPLMATMQVTFFSTNKYFVDWRAIIDDCISCVVASVNAGRITYWCNKIKITCHEYI